MEENKLAEEREKILRLEDDVKRIREKEIELRERKKDYFDHYFESEREDFAHLTNIPENPRLVKHPLWDSSVLNIDVVAECIKELFLRYEKKEMGVRRTSRPEVGQYVFGKYYVDVPILEIYSKERYPKIIIPIEYDRTCTLEDYPTNRPVFWNRSGRRTSERASNYRHLLGYYDGLSFDEDRYEFIKECIYSLAYYQKTHDIPYMNNEETIKVFQKIFR